MPQTMQTGNAKMRDRVYFERRGAAVNDGYGNTTSEWERLHPDAENDPIPARIRPVRATEKGAGGFEVEIIRYEITVRSTPDTQGVKSTDRIVNALDGTVYEVFSNVNFDERERFRTLTCDTGRLHNG